MTNLVHRFASTIGRILPVKIESVESEAEHEIDDGIGEFCPQSRIADHLNQTNEFIHLIIF